MYNIKQIIYTKVLERLEDYKVERNLDGGILTNILPNLKQRVCIRVTKSTNGHSLQLTVTGVKVQDMFIYVDDKEEYLDTLCTLLENIKKQLNSYLSFTRQLDNIYKDNPIQRWYETFVDTNYNNLYIKNSNNGRIIFLSPKLELNNYETCNIVIKLIHYDCYIPYSFKSTEDPQLIKSNLDFFLN